MNSQAQERSPYEIQKGDLVVAISRSLTEKYKNYEGIGLVLEVLNQEDGDLMTNYRIYWCETGNILIWAFGPGYLKRVS